MAWRRKINDSWRMSLITPHNAAVRIIGVMRYLCITPIVHSHPLVAFALPTGWDFWEPIDRAYLARCDEVVVLTLDGWKESTGVRAEIALARELGKPVRFLGVDEATGSPTVARVAPGSPG